MSDCDSPPLGLMYQLARSGGTLVSRCLGAMDSVCLLSEINPASVSRFQPLRQAAAWHGLLMPDEVHDLVDHDSRRLREAIELLRERAAERGRRLVIRDWSHRDWVGLPLEQPTGHSGWHQLWSPDQCPAPPPRAEFSLIRHPLDVFISIQKMLAIDSIEAQLTVLAGMRRFAEFAVAGTCFRFEDFLLDPRMLLQTICDVLGVDYDLCWQERWRDYRLITGDVSGLGDQQIGPRPRAEVTSSVWSRLAGNEDFQATIDLLGYATPEPFRRPWWNGWPNGEQTDGEPTGVGTNESQDWDSKAWWLRGQVRCHPDDRRLRWRLAEALRWTGQVQEAAGWIEGLLADTHTWDPDQQAELFRVGCETLASAQQLSSLIALRRRWLAVCPSDMSNLFELTRLLAETGEIDETLTYCRLMLDRDQQPSGAAANYLLYLNYCAEMAAGEIAQEHFRVALRFAQRQDRLAIRPRHDGEPIRVGYLSSDFYQHPVAKLTLPILRHHDRDRFQISLFHDREIFDTFTAEAESLVNHFLTTSSCSDETLLRLIREQNLDILIDLGGYTNGGRRMAVLARRAAPIQASYLGYPNTSALPAVDYRITDRFADPPGEADRFYGERLVRLEHSHLAWVPREDVTQRDDISRSDGPVLGLFNNVAKVSAAALDAFATIMRRVPRAKLLLKYADRYRHHALQDRYRREFAVRGVAADRLCFVDHGVGMREHFALLASVDLALDPFPYQGTMTTLECLAVGTPVISLCGEYYARRATSAMLMHLDLAELVAECPAEYIELAVQLLSDLKGTRTIRQEIIRRFYDSDLTDPAGLTRELETIYHGWVHAAAAEELYPV